VVSASVANNAIVDVAFDYSSANFLSAPYVFASLLIDDNPANVAVCVRGTNATSASIRFTNKTGSTKTMAANCLAIGAISNA